VVLDPSEVDVSRVANGLVIEATGTSSGLELAGDLVKTTGTLGIFGYHQSERGRRTVDMSGWNFRCLKVLNLQHRERANLLRWMDRAQRMSARGVLKPSELVDDFADMDELPKAFQDDPRSRDVIKTVLRPTKD
jgi:threonine dehydrogenase-like Zn-dependent dehydrogenase